MLRSVPRPIRALRLARLALHLAIGLATIVLCFPFADAPTRARLRQRWSRRLVALCGIEVERHGEFASGALLALNHVSWIDVFVVLSQTDAAFIAKAEVRRWPIIGWLAARNETIFLRRGSRGHAAVLARELVSHLRQGQSVALFPEGTTTDGLSLHPFHAALLQPAIDAGAPVQAVAIRYYDADGRRTTAAAFYGQMTLMQSLVRIVREPRLRARLDVSEPLPTQGADRKALTRALEAWVRERIEEDLPSP
ncbi:MULTISPECIES: lysophospholipid acyltransferase family protein [Tepidiphilus]|jgi:1-acyl-sn-glycerol-3-phosphate acyltransferase|uniref:lysophospholipid acyltransferase family protein n=1 Tax=Tepidiphilus TaxID=203470 RepID=UPI00115E82D7|nr:MULTISPECIES: lysophospholipid acyltransferase family protein [Tepidiphilus]